MANKTDEPLRWSLTAAAKEFGRDRSTIAQRLTQAGIAPGEDDKYSTKQIVSAVYGDKDSVELSIANEKDRKLKLENDETEGRLVSAEFFERKLENLLVTIRQKILSIPDLTEARKKEILDDLKTSND